MLRLLSDAQQGGASEPICVTTLSPAQLTPYGLGDFDKGVLARFLGRHALADYTRDTKRAFCRINAAGEATLKTLQSAPPNT